MTHSGESLHKWTPNAEKTGMVQLLGILVGVGALAAPAYAFELDPATAESVVEEFTEAPSEEGLSGVYLEALMADDGEHANSAERAAHRALEKLKKQSDRRAKRDARREEKRQAKQARKDGHKTYRTDILLIAETGNPGSAETQNHGRNDFKLNSSAVGTQLKKNVPENLALNYQSLRDWIIASYPSNSALKTSAEALRPYLIEAAIQAVALNPTMPEKQIRDSMAALIVEASQSDADKLLFLTLFSDRLESVYNAARNPMMDNKTNNPKGVEVPDGDLTLNGIMTAAAKMDRLQAGMCSDIAEQIAYVGAKVFPDRDVLTFTRATHVAVVISDGKTNHIIDYSKQFTMTGQLLLDPTREGSHSRVGKVVGGRLKEIAVVDTQLNQAMNQFFDTGIPTLGMTAIPTVIRAEAKKVWGLEDTGTKSLGLSAGTAQLSGSSVLVAVLRFKNEDSRRKFYAGIGTASQNFNGIDDRNFQIHLKAGFEKTLFRYVNPRFNIKGATGAHFTAAAMSVPGSPGSLDALPYDTNLFIENRVEVGAKGEGDRAAEFQGNVSLVHALGPKNWGEIAGTLKQVNGESLFQALGDLYFHLNQIQVDGTLRKPLSSNVTSVTQASYTGSNVGQRIDTTTGLEIKGPKDIDILFFVGGGTTELPGYQTQHSLLYGPSGGKAGIRVKTVKGIEAGGSVQGVGSGNGFFQGTVKIPIRGKSRRK